MNSKTSNTFLTLPNLISLLRIGLIPVFVLMVFKRKASLALLIFLLAGATDFLDGLFARLFKKKTKIGIFLDPAADKLLMTASYIVLTIPSLNSLNLIPLWLTATVIGRDLMIVLGALVINRMTGQSTFLPSILGKISTVCQVGTILLVLFFNYLQISPLYLKWVFYLTLAFTFFSCINYVIIGVNLISSPKRS
jgi:cardiolipin synthase